MDNIINELTNKDDTKAYARTKEIAAASEASPAYYSCLELFASLLNDKKTYIRTRAFILCCSQARWDDEGKLKQLLQNNSSEFDRSILHIPQWRNSSLQANHPYSPSSM